VRRVLASLRSAGRDRIGLRLARSAPAALAVVALTASIASTQDRARATELQTIEIASKTGVHAFEVEMAITPEEKEHGLMFRKELPAGHGMLFDFQFDQPVAFWMKNTYIPLDMLFIRSDGRILRIAENTEPFSERNIPSGGPVRAVLEVIGGTAKKLGIAPGDRVGGSIFSAH
jgi:uncharacterized membrane protein (UPF0127 family)